MSKELETCFACGELSPRIEQHHFPVPRRHHGTATVPLCIKCHDWVDRVPFMNWPFDMYLEGFSEMNKAGKLAMLKIASLAQDSAHEDSNRRAELIS